ncbi:hypothetical protein ACCS66_37850, partial [Rhizobium ruizarguesonis]
MSVTRQRRAIPYGDAVSSYVDTLDSRRGAVFSSNYEYPGRYTRWDTAVVDPPLGISSFGLDVWIEAYNERGIFERSSSVNTRSGFLTVRSRR